MKLCKARIWEAELKGRQFKIIFSNVGSSKPASTAVFLDPPPTRQQNNDIQHKKKTSKSRHWAQTTCLSKLTGYLFIDETKRNIHQMDRTEKHKACGQVT